MTKIVTTNGLITTTTYTYTTIKLMNGSETTYTINTKLSLRGYLLLALIVSCFLAVVLAFCSKILG